MQVRSVSQKQLKYSLVEVTVNKTSVEGTRGVAHEMGVRVAGAAEKLVAKVLLNTPFIPLTAL